MDVQVNNLLYIEENNIYGYDLEKNIINDSETRFYYRPPYSDWNEKKKISILRHAVIFVSGNQPKDWIKLTNTEYERLVREDWNREAGKEIISRSFTQKLESGIEEFKAPPDILMHKQKIMPKDAAQEKAKEKLVEEKKAIFDENNIEDELRVLEAAKAYLESLKSGEISDEEFNENLEQSIKDLDLLTETEQSKNKWREYVKIGMKSVDKQIEDLRKSAIPSATNTVIEKIKILQKNFLDREENRKLEINEETETLKNDIDNKFPVENLNRKMEQVNYYLEKSVLNQFDYQKILEMIG